MSQTLGAGKTPAQEAEAVWSRFTANATPDTKRNLQLLVLLGGILVAVLLEVVRLNWHRRHGGKRETVVKETVVFALGTAATVAFVFDTLKGQTVEGSVKLAGGLFAAHVLIPVFWPSSSWVDDAVVMSDDDDE